MPVPLKSSSRHWTITYYWNPWRLGDNVLLGRLAQGWQGSGAEGDSGRIQPFKGFLCTKAHIMNIQTSDFPADWSTVDHSGWSWEFSNFEHTQKFGRFSCASMFRKVFPHVFDYQWTLEESWLPVQPRSCYSVSCILWLKDHATMSGSCHGIWGMVKMHSQQMISASRCFKRPRVAVCTGTIRVSRNPAQTLTACVDTQMQRILTGWLDHWIIGSSWQWQKTYYFSRGMAGFLVSDVFFFFGFSHAQTH